MTDLFHEYLKYNHETGLFLWIKKSSNRTKVGDVAGSIQSLGYLQITLRGKSFYAHRLAWFFVYGINPESEIDHINGDRRDNRIENLRICNRSVNIQNRKGREHQGTYFDGRRKKWVAEICVNNKKKYLGSFTSIEAASAAYLFNKPKYHPLNPRVRT